MDLGWMFGWVDFAEDLQDVAVRTDDHCGTFDAHVFAAIHRFLNPETVTLDGFFGLVREQREGKGMFGNELAVGGWGIGADTENGAGKL